MIEELEAALKHAAVESKTAGHGMSAYCIGSWHEEGKAEVILQAARLCLHALKQKE